MHGDYVNLVESTLDEVYESRDGVAKIDPGHVKVAKTKLKKGGEAFDKYMEFLKKEELTRLTPAGRDHYVKRLKKMLKVTEAEETCECGLEECETCGCKDKE